MPNPINIKHLIKHIKFVIVIPVVGNCHIHLSKGCLFNKMCIENTFIYYMDMFLSMLGTVVY